MAVKLTLQLILRVSAWILCIIAIALLADYIGGEHVGYRFTASNDALKIANGSYIIILSVLLGFAVFHTEPEKTVEGMLLAIGFILCFAGGLAVIVYFSDHKGLHIGYLFSGIMSLVASAIMFVDCLAAFNFI
ncbi:uncharacterized protein LOC132697135 [Cylas formicarius]|uniref:uncharacterized protein LOC132697135 n=1 Tax=Cylas formicarius TaxID=197179 RepID=UPI0029583BDE|nr:uncharacterized protein LOC132697135 [Cylas formicarius]